MKRGKSEGKGSITPLGLAIAHASAGVVPFDFLNPKEPPVERDVQKIRRIVLGATAAALFLICVVYGVMYRASYENQLDTLLAEYNKPRFLKSVPSLKTISANCGVFVGPSGSFAVATTACQFMSPNP